MTIYNISQYIGAELRASDEEDVEHRSDGEHKKEYRGNYFQGSYEGAWRNKKRHGHGMLTGVSSAYTFTYTGNFVDGFFSGKGQSVSNTVRGVQVTSCGDWATDLPHGNCIVTSKTLDSIVMYKGEFKEGIPDGRCVAHQRGRKFEGIFKPDPAFPGIPKFYEGLCTATTVNEAENITTRYEKGKVANKYLKYKNGIYWQWETSGTYTVTYPNGTIAKEDLGGPLTITMPSGHIYIGAFRVFALAEGGSTMMLPEKEDASSDLCDGLPLPHGMGEMKYIMPKGIAMNYKGGFKEGLKDGKGSMTYPDGQKDEGSWRKDLCHGLMKRYHVDGSISERRWTYGVPEDRILFHSKQLGDIWYSEKDDEGKKQDPYALLEKRKKMEREAAEETAAREKKAEAETVAALVSAAAAAAEPAPQSSKTVPCSLKTCKFQHQIPNGNLTTLTCTHGCRNDYHASCFQELAQQRGISGNIKAARLGALTCTQCKGVIVRIDYMKNFDEVRAVVKLGEYGR